MENEIQIYNVEVAESLIRMVPIAAHSEVEAVEKAAMQYQKEQIVLAAEDFVSVDFKVRTERRTRNDRRNV